MRCELYALSWMCVANMVGADYCGLQVSAFWFGVAAVAFSVASILIPLADEQET